MHELGIATEIVRLLENQRLQRGFARVNIVRLRAGGLSGVDGQALQLAFEIARDGSCAAGAVLQLEQRAMTLLCRPCGQESPCALGGGPETCPACGSSDLIIQGEEGIDVVSIEVD
ncbi:MAG: hydrogenase maturation nickel metallochaperone HypA [Planctomycetota bacterium]